MITRTIRNIIIRALTKTKPTQQVRTRALRVEEIPPSERLVLAVELIIVTTFCLTALEFAHLLMLHQWNSEVFAGITGLVGTLTGVLLGRTD